eukprot:Seg3650.2 transcript_id=Seg3650.2/GoldUCD/mRNA.D3Y31 product="hypothetical protein" protein_id=Seg3650.2/GoldUCD/D3Y31
MASAKEKVAVSVAFDRYIEGEELFTIMKETFKYVLFLRRQLPLPVMLLEREQQLAEATTTKQGPKPATRLVPVGFKGLKWKKRNAAINAINNITNAIEDFVMNTDIKAIALLFGSTIVSPKEIFILRPNFESESGSCSDKGNETSAENRCTSNGLQESCTSKDMQKKSYDKTARFVMKHLIINPILSSLGDLRPSNVFTFILSPRCSEEAISCQISPKQNYQIPKRGKFYEIILTNEADSGNSSSLTSGKGTIEHLEELQRNMDLIWYQARDCVKGFSE